MYITICNQEVYNPRKDLKIKLPWVKLSTDICFSQSLFGMDHKTKWLWICLITLCGKQLWKPLKADFKYLAAMNECTIDEVKAQLKLFEEKEMISLSEELAVEPVRIREESAPRREEIERRVKREEKRNKNAEAFILFDLWNKHKGNLSEAIELSDKRKRASLARWQEKPDEEYWIKIIEYLKNDPFWNGEKTGTPIATFDRFVQKDKHIEYFEKAKLVKRSAKHGVVLGNETCTKETSPF